ncbi:aldo/keto reductase [Yaniella halotolerans]|uniref:aldo/keto reductase n=1 Tax=Yaniella halotolerans TaxID=225453 RepID=UPI0003B5B7CF|nr:aldo/keto reductase [Yaniella halotolerans]
MTTSPMIAFYDGHQIPQLGYGVWQVENDVTEDVVGQALAAGYRHIDTAHIYGNESGVGAALRASGLDRDDVFITSKLWNDDHGYDATLKAFDATMENLGLDVLDLFLIHFPVPSKTLRVETWKAFIELHKQGRIRSIGVSNFRVEDLEELEAATGIIPVINQIELHPYFGQQQLREYHASKAIVTESWSPLGQGGGELTDPVIADIATAHGATPAQVIIAWHLALGLVVIPKSETPERIVANFESLDLRLSATEIAAISALDKGESGRQGANPNTFS